mmetsp:Transcript_26513/g.62313  ORF Transcript_26513/g.62313 Transcript_26513/m.62313 type:complete len:260 (-) Transcript_26513:365-1144(-)
MTSPCRPVIQNLCGFSSFNNDYCWNHTGMQKFVHTYLFKGIILPYAMFLTISIGSLFRCKKKRLCIPNPRVRVRARGRERILFHGVLLFLSQVAGNPNRMGTLGDDHIVLSPGDSSREHDLVAVVRASVLPVGVRGAVLLAVVAFRLAYGFHSDRGGDFHSDDQGMKEAHRAVHGHALGKAGLGERPHQAGYQGRRQNGRSHRPRSNPALRRFVIRIERRLTRQFLSAAGQQGLSVRPRSEHPVYARRLPDKIVPDYDA